MYKQCQTEYSAARQQLVEKSFLRELEQRHYEDITVQELCEKTGVSRKSFYRYFSGKQGVLEAMVDRKILESDMSFSAEALPGLYEQVMAFYQYWRDSRGFLDTLDRSGLLGVLVDRATEVLQADIPSHLPNASWEERCAVRYQLEFIVSGLMRMMLLWYRDGFVLSTRQMAAATVPLLDGQLNHQQKRG